MNFSMMAFGSSALASNPVSGEMRTVTMPSGTGTLCRGTPLSASCMKNIQLGRAAREPCSSSPSVRS